LELLNVVAVSFDFRRRLGAGYFGEVWEAVETGLGHRVALKCIPPDKIINPDNFFQEAQILKASEHENIVRVYDTGTLDDGRIYVSMEYVPAGSLEDLTKGAPLGLSVLKRIMVDVLRGLGHAHSQGVVHRDIKPANILIGSSGEGLLSDFGLAIPNIRGKRLSRIKKYDYALHLAPEVEKLKDYTALSDIYSCGVTLYRLANGDSTLPQVEPEQAVVLAKTGEFPDRRAYRDFVPQGLRRLINKAISVQPSSRFRSAEEMRHALEHQLLLVDWEEFVSRQGTTWVGAQGHIEHKVAKLQQANGLWSIETLKDSGSGLRRVGKDCFLDLRRRDADKRARRILQGLASMNA
jgi:eukaryotic-like serine/threonine-protein kinase